jgi:branched-chain amino acid transport system substrate-binding protein
MFKRIFTPAGGQARKLIGAVAASTALAFGAFGGSAAAQETYRFAIANDLSGPSSFHGKTFASGFNTYLREVNDAGGVNSKKVELLQENAERNVQKEVGFLRKFAQQDRALAAMVVTTDGLFAAKPLTESLKVPLTGIGVPELASNPVHPWLFNIFASYQDTVFAAVDHVFNTIGDKDPKIGVIYPDSQYGLEAVRATELRLQKYGKPVTAKVVMNFRETDATTQMLTLKQAGVKYVIAQMTAFHMAAILRDAAKVGLNATFFGTTQTMDREPDLILSQPGGQDLAKHFIGVGPWSKWSETSVPGVVAMRAAVKKYDKMEDEKLGDLMYSNFVQGYVTAMVMVEGLRKSGPAPTAEKLRDALNQLRNFDTKGITPPISFGPDRHKGFNAVKLYRINAERKVYEPIGDWVTPN